MLTFSKVGRVSLQNKMHPNWKALSTIDFPRKTFVRPTENTIQGSAESRAANFSVSSGDEVRKFYEEVLSIESSVKQEEEKPKNLRRERRRTHRKQFIRVKSEFKEKTEVDLSVMNKAFVAAQNDDLDCLRRIFGDATTVASLLSARDSYSWTLLMVAACANAERVVGFLLEFEIVDLKPKDRAGNTAIDLASKKGHRKIVAMIRSKQAAMTPPKEKLPSKSTAKISSTATTSNGGDMFCDVCNATFGNVDDWKKHVTSMLHLLNRSKQQIEAGQSRTHFMIPEANRGFQMMVNTGWEKKGLGPTGSGKLFPVKTVLKRDRTGLGFEGDQSPARVTHFDANDVSSVADLPSKRHERESTFQKRKKCKEVSKEKLKEVQFRREFSSM